MTGTARCARRLLKHIYHTETAAIKENKVVKATAAVMPAFLLPSDETLQKKPPAASCASNVG